jgi:hypothetical protein
MGWSVIIYLFLAPAWNCRKHISICYWELWFVQPWSVWSQDLGSSACCWDFRDEKCNLTIVLRLKVLAELYTDVKQIIDMVLVLFIDQSVAENMTYNAILVNLIFYLYYEMHISFLKLTMLLTNVIGTSCLIHSLVPSLLMLTLDTIIPSPSSPPFTCR